MEARLVPATWTVTTNADGTNPVPPGSLRDCINQANNSGDTIQFGISQQIISLVAGISSNKSLTIDGGLNAGNVIDGTGTLQTGRLQAFNFTAGLASVTETISNLQIRNCYSGFANDGGAIYVQGTLTLTNDTFNGNEASASGGAVAMRALGAGNTLTVTNSTFAQNFTTAGRGGNGGAISVTARGTTGGSVTLNKVGITQNTADGNGGAIYAPGGDVTTTLVARDSVFANNTAGGSGGAIWTRDPLSVSSNTTRSYFNANEATNGTGGAIFCAPPYDNANFGASITGVGFNGNGAVRGGAVDLATTENSGTATISVIQCLFNNNWATNTPPLGVANDGGGLYVDNTTGNTGSASLTVTNSTFYQNHAAAAGGGLVVWNANNGAGQNTVALTSLTIYSNMASTQGGGLWVLTPPNAGLARIRNSIIAGNLAQESPADVYGHIFSSGHNLIGAVDPTNSNDWVGTDKTGTVDNPKSAGLDGQLTDNGGWTMTLRVMPFSEALGNGDPGLQGTADQRGWTRGQVVCIGAYDPNAVQP
jgi:predicted outer membrane repeat protein